MPGLRRLALGRPELRAQAADVRLDDVGLWIKMKVPHGFEQHCARHDSVGVARRPRSTMSQR